MDLVGQLLVGSPTNETLVGFGEARGAANENVGLQCFSQKGHQGLEFEKQK